MSALGRELPEDPTLLSTAQHINSELRAIQDRGIPEEHHAHVLLSRREVEIILDALQDKLSRVQQSEGAAYQDGVCRDHAPWKRCKGCEHIPRIASDFPPELAALYSARDELRRLAMYDFRVFDEPEDLDDQYDDEPEEGEERCVECGYVMPSDLIEHIDDMYLGWCRPCTEGR